jgi:hypothetical protein
VKRLSYGFLIPAALLLAVLPLGAEPHLVEKLRMLATGRLTRPLDIFDLVLHGGLLALLGAKAAGDLVRWRRRRSATDAAGVEAQAPGSDAGARQ